MLHMLQFGSLVVFRTGSSTVKNSNASTFAYKLAKRGQHWKLKEYSRLNACLVQHIEQIKTKTES